MLKFRKMSHQATGLALTTNGDARFTRIGGLLAKLKIDEIPQLLHVLKRRDEPGRPASGGTPSSSASTPRSTPRS